MEALTPSEADSLYEIAGRGLATSLIFPQLSTFISKPGHHTDIVIRRSSVSPHQGDVLFDGKIWMGNGERQLRCFRSSQYLIEAEGIGTCTVGLEGEEILVDEQIPEGDFRSELVLGPALILSLAIGGTFSLHASAIELSGKTILFAGDSSAGKSTLARELPALLPSCHRVADDILPLCLHNDQLHALPHYPQFKLPPETQYRQAAPPMLPVSEIVFFGKLEGGHAERQRISSAESFRRLLSHTVAARLFDTPLLERHMEFCRRASQRVPSSVISYPHRPGALQEVAAIFDKELV